MIWYLIICSVFAADGTCTVSPPLRSKAECVFLQKNVPNNSTRPTKCVGYRVEPTRR